MKRPRSPYAPRRSQYAAAAAIAVLGLAVAAVIAVAAVLAGGNVPTAPSSYRVQVVRVADTGPGFAPCAEWSANRDRPCPGGPEPRADSACSSIDQEPFAFTRAFA